MDFTFIRIDDRLIHGQVALGWSRSKGIECILAVDDETAKNSMQCSLLRMATPSGVKSFIVGEKEAYDKIMSGELDHKKTMLLVKSPTTLWNLYKMGVTLNEVNVGNLRTKDGKKLLSFVYASDAEIEDWKNLHKEHIKMYAQALPDQQSTDFNQLLDNL